MIRIGIAIRLILTLLALMLAPDRSTLAAPAQKHAVGLRLVRGPYLQSGAPTSVVVRWRTAQRTTSVVRYGLAPDKLERTAAAEGKLTEHVVRLTGLTPDTRYYYSVGTSNRVLQSSPRNSFRTPPVPGSTRPFRVWVLGDPGTGYAVQKAVRDAYERFSAGQETDLILTLGDNAYPDATDAQFTWKFFAVYRDLLKGAVLWPALGNHDVRSADWATESGVYFESFTLPRLGQAGGVPSGTQAYYSFDYGNTHFICLNSLDSDFATDHLMLTWLRRDLAANDKTWTVSFWHHPPYSKGPHDSDISEGDDRCMTRMREHVLPLLERAGVDLVLCGHSHLYERSFPLHGHYGRSGSLQPDMIRDRGEGQVEGTGAYLQDRRSERPPGTVYVNAGSAGHASDPKKLAGLNHPAMKIGLNVPGSLVLEIAGPRLDATFLDEKGVRRDWFTLTKSP